VSLQDRRHEWQWKWQSFSVSPNGSFPVSCDPLSAYPSMIARIASSSDSSGSDSSSVSSSSHIAQQCRLVEHLLRVSFHAAAQRWLLTQLRACTSTTAADVAAFGQRLSELRRLLLEKAPLMLPACPVALVLYVLGMQSVAPVMALTRQPGGGNGTAAGVAEVDDSSHTDGAMQLRTALHYALSHAIETATANDFTARVAHLRLLHSSLSRMTKFLDLSSSSSSSSSFASSSAAVPVSSLRCPCRRCRCWTRSHWPSPHR
jgi:hypothetical protein